MRSSVGFRGFSSINLKSNYYVCNYTVFKIVHAYLERNTCMSACVPLEHISYDVTSRFFKMGGWGRFLFSSYFSTFTFFSIRYLYPKHEKANLAIIHTCT